MSGSTLPIPDIDPSHLTSSVGGSSTPDHLLSLDDRSIKSTLSVVEVFLWWPHDAQRYQ